MTQNRTQCHSCQGKGHFDVVNAAGGVFTILQCSTCRGAGYIKTQEVKSPLLKMVEVCEIFKVDRVTILRWVDLGRFPQPLKRKSDKEHNYWRKDEIDKHLERMAPKEEANDT